MDGRIFQFGRVSPRRVACFHGEPARDMSTLVLPQSCCADYCRSAHGGSRQASGEIQVLWGCCVQGQRPNVRGRLLGGLKGKGWSGGRVACLPEKNEAGLYSGYWLW